MSDPYLSNCHDPHSCPNHPSLKITYFCASPECSESLCPLCRSAHNHFHSANRTDSIILSFPLVVSQTKQKITQSLSALNNFIYYLKEQNLTERSSPLSARGTPQPQPQNPLILERLGYLRANWADLLIKLDNQDFAESLKMSYGRNFEKEFADAKKLCVREHNSNPSNSRLNEGNVLSGSSRPKRGFASIADEINKLGFKSSQPFQDGIGDHSLASFDEKENNANARLKGYVPWTLDIKCNKKDTHSTSSKDFLTVEPGNLSLSKTGSPISTIKADSNHSSPTNFINLSPSQTIGGSRRQSKFALSPFSVYKTQRADGGSENFDMKIEGGHEEETSHIDLKSSEFKINIVPAASNH